VEGIMSTTILVILCIAAEGFMLYCLFHFGQELRQESQRESAAALWIASPKSNVVPLQFIGHTRIVVWSEGTWNYVLSSADSESPLAQGKDATKEHYDVAA
jgi:hypothetical protein